MTSDSMVCVAPVLMVVYAIANIKTVFQIRRVINVAGFRR